MTLSCPATYGAGSCSIIPASVSSFPATATLIINGTSFTAGDYTLTISGTSGSTVHTLPIPFSVGDYTVSGTQTLSSTAGTQAKANFQLTSMHSYSGKVNASCNVSSLSGAMCALAPANPIPVSAGGFASLAATINIPNDASAGVYSIQVNLQDTTGAPSHSATVSLTIAQDFLVKTSTASQSVTAGQTSGPYALSVQPVGSSFNGPVTLACPAGLPAGAQCIFNPATPVTPGNSAVDAVMNISTQANSARSQAVAEKNISPRWFWLTIATTFMVLSVPRKRSPERARRCLGCAAISIAIVLLVSCAGVSNAGGGGGHPPVTYHITVTGTSVGTPADAGQSTIVALVVN